ncbi:hypothetical protein Y868_08755, partial [Campylobacter jejuni CVM 41918]
MFSLLNADELTEALAKNNNQNSWEHFDYKNTKEAPKIQEENVDFKSTFDSLLSKTLENLSLIHISEPTRLRRISYAVFCL